MIAGERTGNWQRCNARITSTGRATGSCLLPNGRVVAFDPIQFRVNADCSVGGRSDTGIFTYSGQVQAGKRGIIGRFFFDDGERFFGGPLVAAKRG